VTFLDRRPIVLMPDSILVMQLKVGPTKGKKATDVGTSLDVSSLRGGLRTRWICVSLSPFCLNVERRNTTSSGRLSWSQMALDRCINVNSTECFLAVWWCDSAFRHRFVWVGFLYTVHPKDPSGRHTHFVGVFIIYVNTALLYS